MALRDVVVGRLRNHQAELRARGVTRLYLFGSVARGEARPESDIDLFFDHNPGLGLEIVAIEDRIRAILAAAAAPNTAVDITTRRSLHPLLRERIEADAVRVF